MEAKGVIPEGREASSDRCLHRGFSSEETSTVPRARMRKRSLSQWSQLPNGTAQRDRCSYCNVGWRCDPQMSLRSQETRKEKSVAAMNNPGLNVNADKEQTLRCMKSV